MIRSLSIMLATAAAVITLAAAPALAESKALVELKEAATVASSVATLADVAVITDPGKIIANPREIRLGAVPSEGKTRKIDLDDIKFRMDLAGVDVKKVGFTGAGSVTISRGEKSAKSDAASGATEKENRERIARAARALVEREALKMNIDLTVEVIGVRMRYVLKPDGRLVFKDNAYLAEGSKIDCSGLINVIVPILEHDGYTSRVPVVLKITRNKRVAVAARHIRRGNLVIPSDVRIEIKPEYEPGLPAEEVLGKRAEMDIPADSTFIDAMLKHQPLVRKGQIVVVTVVGDGFRIESRGLAAQNGSKGEEILVTGVNSTRNFIATVTGRGKVLLDKRIEEPGKTVERAAGADDSARRDAGKSAGVSAMGLGGGRNR